MTTGPRAALDRIEAGSVPWSLRARADSPLAPFRRQPLRVLTADASLGVEETVRPVLARLVEGATAVAVGAAVVEGAPRPGADAPHARLARGGAATAPHGARAISASPVDRLARPIAPAHRPGPGAPTATQPVLVPSASRLGGQAGQEPRSGGDGPGSPPLPARSASIARGGATPVVPAVAINRARLREMARDGRSTSGPAAPGRPRHEDSAAPGRAAAPHPERGSVPPTTAVRPGPATSRLSPSARGDDRQAAAPWSRAAADDGGQRRPQSLAELVEWAERGQGGAAPPELVNAAAPVARAWPGAGAAPHGPTAGRDGPGPDGPARPTPARDLAWATDVVEAVLVGEARRHGVTVEEQ